MGAFRTFDGYFPGVRVQRLANSINGAGASVEQRPSDPSLTQQSHRTIYGIAFADRPEVKHYPFAIEADGQCFLVEVDMVHADTLAGRVQFTRIRLMAGSTHKAPATNQRGDGYVKSAAAFAVQLFRLPKQRKHRRANSRWLASGMRIYSRDVARRLIQAKGFLQPLDFVQRFLSGSAQADGVIALQHKFKPRGHGVASEADRCVVRSWHR
jgi:hypothetical protein